MHTVPVGEWYEDQPLTLRECTGAEDPTCSAQWARHFHIDEGESSSTDNGESSSSEEIAPKLRVRRRLGSAGSSGSGLAPALADEALLGNSYLDVLVELEQSRDDHLHYLGREMRCPLPASDARTTTAAAGLMGTASTPEQEQQEGSSKSTGATQEQRRQQRAEDRRVVRMALFATLFLCALFGLTIYFAVREGARRRADSMEQACVDNRRETELTPLLMVGARGEPSNTQHPHALLTRSYSDA